MDSVLVWGEGPLLVPLVQNLKESGMRIYILSEHNTYIPGTTLVKSDIFLTTKQNLPKVKTLYFIPSLTNLPLFHYKRNYLNCLLHLLEHVPKDVKFILLSSHHVYGNHYGRTVTESSCVLPYNPIDQVILESENILKNSRQHYVIARAATLFNPSLYTQLIQQKKISFSQRNQLVNFILVDELARALCFLMHQQGTVNVAGPPAMSLHTLLSFLSSKMGCTIKHPKKQYPITKGIELSNERLLQMGFISRHNNLLSQWH